MEANILYVHRFISSLVFTDIVETITLIFLLRYVFKKHGVKLWQTVFAGLYASFSTITYVWFVFPYLVNWPRSTAIIYAEISVFIIEAIFYKMVLRLNWRVAFTISLVCNLVSYFVGPLLRMYGLWPTW